MKTYEVIRLPYQGAKENRQEPLDRLAVLPAASYRDACRLFARTYAYLATTTIWRVRQCYESEVACG